MSRLPAVCIHAVLHEYVLMLKVFVRTRLRLINCIEL